MHLKRWACRLAALMLLWPAVACSTPPADDVPVIDRTFIVGAVRSRIDAGDLRAAERLVTAHEAALGVSPQMLLAQSWLGRGALSLDRINSLTDAERFATRTYAQATTLLNTRGMDDEPDLPTAVGAAIEVLAQVGARRGRRTEAVMYLEGELRKFADTSLPKRIQKNINLITLDGQPAPPLTSTEMLGPSALDQNALQGSVQVLFFWAHWCADCKLQGPVLQELLSRHEKDGLTIVAPTQRFGYVAGGASATPDAERAYIEAVMRASYPWMATRPVPLDEANHLTYGVSTTPTLVIVDRDGLIRAYHPGRMTLDELEAAVRPLLHPRP